MALEEDLVTRARAHGLNSLIGTGSSMRFVVDRKRRRKGDDGEDYVVVHQIASDELGEAMGDDDGVRNYTLQMNAFANTSEEARDIVQQLRNCFQRYRSGDILDILVTGEATLVDDLAEKRGRYLQVDVYYRGSN